jgi:catechol 2,3-dioxygenase-like lactoylglutathione lyase family enzyme
MNKTVLIAALATLGATGFLAPHPVLAADGPMIAGAALNSPDQDKEVKFYTEVMGLKQVGNKMKVAEGTEVILSMDGTFKAPIIAITDFPTKAGRQSFGRLIFNSPDAGSVAAKIKAAGYKVEQAKSTTGGPAPQVYFITDPDGYTIEVFQAGPPPASH